MSGSNSLPPAAAAVADEPLGLTVHALPTPQEALREADPVRRTRIGRWKMISVLLCCAAPVIASYFTYYVVRPEGRSVFGQLIDPQRPTPPIQAKGLAGEAVDLQSLKGQWLIVAVADAACDALCEQQLYLQRQLREVVGREKDRIDRVWLVTDDQAVPDRLSNGLQGATVLRVPPDALAQWLQPEAGHTLAEHLYVVDPMGNWMLRYPAAMDAKMAAKAKRDIERLLRASSSWDNAGR